MRIGVLLGLSMLACGGGSDASSEPAPSPTCSAANWSGTYAFTYTRQAGDCTDIPAETGKLASGYPEPLSAGCTIEANDWQDGCSLHRRIHCITPEKETTNEGTWYAVQSDGAELGGQFALTVKNNSTVGCSGVFAFEAMRQGM